VHQGLDARPVSPRFAIRHPVQVYFSGFFMFRNLHVFRLPAPWSMGADALSDLLSTHTFLPCTGLQMASLGWAPPRPNGPLVHVVNKQMLLMLGKEKKLLPASVINQFTKAKAGEIEEQEGYKPGRKRMKEIKEQITDDLLPRAFAIRSNTLVWIDPVNGWLVIDSSSAAKSEEVMSLLVKCIPQFPIDSLVSNQSPVSAMTQWLSEGEAPAGFTIDQDTELTSSGEGKATVRYVRHALEADEVQRHIAGGKKCTRLAMTWSDRISFVLTEALLLKRIAALDVLKEEGGNSKDEDERFDSDFALMSGEIDRMLRAVIDALGGLRKDAVAA
jgi:recombination associated protein RdgC